MANLLLNLVGWAARQARHRFIQQTHRTEAIQAEFLRSLLRANQQTALGRDLGLDQLDPEVADCVARFRQQVPISRYQDYESYVDRTFQGEANVMVPDPVLYFSLTSGSTGKQKLLPITKRSRQAVSRANQISMGFGAEAAKQSGRSLNRMLYINSARPYGYSPQGIAYGPISVGDLNLLGPVYQRIFAHPVDVLRIKDSATRNYLALLFALRDRNVGIVSATFPIYALTFSDFLAQHAESLLNDLDKGTLTDWLELDAPTRHALEQQCRSHPQRAAELRTLLNTTGTLRPKAVWPNLSFMVTARGGNSNFYFERFSEYFGDLPIFGGTYASAEATYGVHRDFGTDGVILALSSGFYEFIPESAWDAHHPQTLLPHEVTVGDRYRIVVTAFNGLYRYDVGDVVEIEGFYNTAPIFIFRHRQGGVLSATTEKTTEYHVVQTMRQLQTEFDIILENFCITLSQSIPPHYWVNIELTTGHQLDNPAKFIRRFDEILSQVHRSYGLKRPNPVPDPQLRILAAGSFQQVRQQFIDRGVLESQIKFPHISSDRSYLAGLTIEQEVKISDSP
jgi:hypothetical protein